MVAERGYRKTIIGIVTSDRMNKTVTVTVQRSIQHTIYKKFINRSSKVLAHDENNECKIGDKVRIMETRPLSRRKRWRICEVIERTH